jgi:hypothetical protein
MGLFSAKKKTVVSSVVYNLAGDELDRVNYLKTVVIGGVLADGNRSMSDTLTGSYLNGPGISLRAFGRWARNQGYNASLGLSPGTLTLTSSLNLSALAGLIPHDPEENVLIQTAEIGAPDYTYWVDRYMVENHPAELDTNYVANFDEATNTITVTLDGGLPETFTPVGYNPHGRYLYSSYSITSGATAGPIVTGSTVTLAPGDSFPDTSTWELTDFTDTFQAATLAKQVTTTVSYSDGRPNEVTVTNSSAPGDYYDQITVWGETEYLGDNGTGSGPKAKRKIMTQTSDGSVQSSSSTTTTNETIDGGVTKTTKTDTVEDVVVFARSYRIDEQDITYGVWQPMQILIYERNTGNVGLDALFATAGSGGTFFPPIPLRLNNRFVSDTILGDIYPKAKRALKKAVSASFDDLIEKIADNESIGDIDYAFAVFGVSLNVKENACKRYLYEFFQETMLGQDLSGAGYTNWKLAWEASHTQWMTWQGWYYAQSEPGTEGYATEEPPRPTYPPAPSYQIRTASDGRPDVNYDMTVSWVGVEETVGSGQGKPGAKVGELWFDTQPTDVFIQSAYISETDGTVPYEAQRIDHVRLTWQTSANTWRRLDIHGLKHRNLVYGGKAIEIMASEALADADESGFIIPLHEDVFRRMPLVEATQMSTACCFLVFNCYEIVKQKWYQSSLFKIFLVVAVIAITVYTGGAGAGSIGLLGTNAAVGAALGFAGTAAIVAGAVANALAAMLLTQILTKASSALFGDKIGLIIGTLASLIAIQVGSAYMSGTSLSGSFGNLMKAENLLKLTVAAGDGYAGYMKAGAQETMLKTQKLLTTYGEQSAELSAKFEETFGTAGGAIDPLAFTEAGSTGAIESSESFLGRTLLTGSEIAEMSKDMLTNFVEITTQTDLKA